MKIKNKMLFRCVIILFFILISCNTTQRRTELVESLSNIFYDNYDHFEEARLYLSGSYENTLYSGFKIDYQENRVEAFRHGCYIKLPSIYQTSSDTIASNILIFMKKCRIRIFEGGDKWCLVVFNDFDYKHYPCYSFQYRSDFDTEKEKTKQEIENFNNSNTPYWTYTLCGKWFIQGESCF